MNNPAIKSQRTKQIALLTVFTALYIVLRFIPFSIIIGPSGGFLSLSDFIAPVIGIILGPYIGGLCVALGSFGAIGLGRPVMFFGLDFIPDLVAVLATGFLMQQKRSRWAIVVAIDVALLAIFMINPLTSVFVFSVPFAWLHIAAFIVLLTPLSLMAAKSLTKVDAKKIVPGLVVLVFIGVMMQHLAGNILYEVVLGQVTNSVPAVAYAPMWSAVFFVYPVERSILVFSAVLIGTPLIFLFNRVPFLNPRNIAYPKPPAPEKQTKEQ